MASASPGRSDEQRRAAALEGFTTLASTAGSIFPVVLPFIAVGEGVLAAVNKLWDATEERETYRISEPLKLFGPRTPRAKTLRAGSYVVLSEPLDGTQCQLAEDGQLTTLQGAELVGKAEAPVSYAVLRIDLVKEAPVDFVVSQRVATLLTQLQNTQEGQPAGPLKTSFGFLTDTLTAYTNFTDLQRYHELLKKGDARTAGETEQMHRLEQREALKPFLPKAAG